ncbi:hypothetical protein E8E12_004076 [Didymella heteroderae]|uniref:Uncharacterized protein n=1 Tax=Didymella heteroderae TaxID=1769908 RepID=A0A9P4WMC4_9PLEO|nr:hypothetical protein E8E12_004076 [Didymella heteroderae]
MNLDGASDSKPALETVQEHHGTLDLKRKPSKLRRFMSMGSRDRKSSSRLDMIIKPGSTPPLQTLSPRPTEFEPCAKKHAKRSISTFLLSKASSVNELESAKDNRHDGHDASAAQGQLLVTETASLSLPAAAVQEDEIRLGNQGHLPVTGNPYQSAPSQLRKDSVTKSFYDMPLAASRTAALTSHPVGKVDLESEEFQTPRESDGV